MSSRSDEIDEFSSGPDSANKKAAKRLIANAASDMDQYTHRMDSELPLFNAHLNNALGALTKAATISADFNSNAEALAQAEENMNAVRKLRETMATTETQMLSFETSVSSLPRLTTVLNRSKAAMAKVIKRLQAELRNGQALAREAEVTYSSILEQSSDI